MKKHGNTLYITTQGAYVSRDGENLVVSIDRIERLRLPIHTISGAVSFGNVLWTPFALGLCGEHGVSVSMMTESGRFMARSCGPQTGSIILRRAQHQASRSDETISLAARCFIIGKITNARTVLRRAQREYFAEAPCESIDAVTRLFDQYLNQLQHPLPVDTVRGIEGDAARQYFSVFDQLIRAQKKDFFLRERSRRPPMDRVNTLLSFVYTLLVHDVAAACESVGLDPQMGFLHADRPGRPSLALDLMEEFRSWLADRLVLSLINRGQVQPKGFITAENGSVKMDDDTRRTVLVAWKERKDTVLVHPFINERLPIGLVPYVQAQLMARWLRGDLDAYPPYFYK
ncbi:MAG: type I-C CRISPR-associated endonuclease Cas1 [Thermoguttaceae bacterium]|nr:type I-C CRISPR-associated endonuclease Cas1 [Thermoguttaceae bacterium]